MGSYGEIIRAPSVPELVHFDRMIGRDGTIGGSDGDIYRRWDPESLYDK